MSSERADIERLSDDIKSEAVSRRADGVPAELERVLDKASGPFRVPHGTSQRGGRLKAILRQTERLSFINPHVSNEGRRPYFVPLKRGIQTAVRWYVGAVVSQIQEFIRADLHAMRVAADAIESLEERVMQLEARVAELTRASTRRPEA